MEPHSTEASKRDETPKKTSHLSENSCNIPVASFDLLNKYGCQFKHSRRGEANAQSSQTATRASSRQVLSAESISRVAKMRSLKQSQGIDSLPPLKEPRETHQGVDDGDFEDIELALDLTLAAEKVSNREFDDAEKLLSSCRHVAAATPVQKVVHYFAKALQERIDTETGRIDLERETVRVEEFASRLQPEKVALEVELPYSQITGLVATQAIMESVGSASRIHIIGFTNQSRSHWPILMHAVANRENCPLELLKITAVGTYEDTLEETGRWLSSFAESINLPFSYKVAVSELEGFNTNLLELGDGEAVVLYVNFRLWSLLAWPDRLEAFIGAVKSLNPRLMVVSEAEASTNTSPFLPRFREALFCTSAILDCFETVLQPDSQFRKIVEEVHLWNGIRDVVIHDGEERIQRQERIDFWRALFARFGLVEVELSYSSLYLASLVAKCCSCWSSCTMNMDGKSIIIRWKGTPIKSISAWKFPRN